MRLSTDAKSHIRRRATAADRNLIRALAESDDPSCREVGQAMMEAIAPEAISRTTEQMGAGLLALDSEAGRGRVLAELKAEMPALTEVWGVFFTDASPNFLRRCMRAWQRGAVAFAGVLVELLTEAALDGMIVEHVRLRGDGDAQA